MRERPWPASSRENSELLPVLLLLLEDGWNSLCERTSQYRHCRRGEVERNLRNGVLPRLHGEERLSVRSDEHHAKLHLFLLLDLRASFLRRAGKVANEGVHEAFCVEFRQADRQPALAAWGAEGR